MSFWHSLLNRGVVAILALLQLVSEPKQQSSGGAGGSCGGGADFGCDDRTQAAGMDSHVAVRHSGVEDGQYGVRQTFSCAPDGSMFVLGTTHLWWDPR